MAAKGKSPRARAREKRARKEAEAQERKAQEYRDFMTDLGYSRSEVEEFCGWFFAPDIPVHFEYEP
jgi:hypothetical protein